MEEDFNSKFLEMATLLIKKQYIYMRQSITSHEILAAILGFLA